LWGKPGDIIIDVRMLKLADEEGVGPMEALIDTRAGLVLPAPGTQLEHFMLDRLVFTAADLARFWFAPPNQNGEYLPTRSDTAKARRRIEKHLGPDPERRPELTIQIQGKGKQGTTYSVVFSDLELRMKSGEIQPNEAVQEEAE
jgi:hypothetical protein